MPYTIERKKNDSGVISTYSGKVTDAEFQQCMKEKFFLSKEILSPKKVGPLRYSISDCSDVSNFDVSVEAVKWVAHLSKTVMKANPTILMAIIAPNNHEFGMGRLWQAYMGSHSERAKIFRTKEQASNWIAQTLALPEKAV
jgi:hypothetical protein